MRPTRADGETIQAVIGLRPPAIQNRKIEAAVQNHFLTAGSGRFQRPPGVIQPHINALHQVSPHVDVVILDENEAVGKLAVTHKLRDLLEDALAGFVAGMGLSGENKLHGAFGIVGQRGQHLDIGQNQVGALIGGKAAGKSDGQGVGAQNAAQALPELQRLRRGAPPVRWRACEQTPRGAASG